MKIRDDHKIVTILVITIIFIIPSLFIILNNREEYETYKHSIIVFEAATDKNNLSFEDIKDNAKIQYQQFNNSRVPYSYSDYDTWIRMKIDHTLLNLEDSKFSITLENPNIDYIDGYIPIIDDKNNLSYVKYEKGLMRLLRDNEINNNKWNLIIPKNIAHDEYIYLKVKSNVDVDVSVENCYYSANNTAYTNLYFGIFFGFLIAVIIYNLFVYVSLKEKYFIYYVLYVTSMLLYQMRIHCFLSFFINTSYQLYMRLLWVFVLFMFLFAVMFSIKFLDTKNNCRKLDILLKVITIIAIIVSLSGVMGYYKWADKIMHYVQIACPLIIIAIALIRVKQKFRPAIYFLNGWIMITISSIIWSIAVYLPSFIPTQYILQAGFGAEAIFLSLSLTDKFKSIILEKEIIKLKEAKYRQLSIRDPLTNLFNKRYLIESIQKQIYSTTEISTSFCIIVIDIDNFKLYNDTLGHLEGDKIIIKISEIIQSNLRGSDIPCRYGGDEIVIILPHTPKDKASILAERIRNEINNNICVINNEIYKISVSIGITEYIYKESLEEFVKRGDLALYEAKEKGKNMTIIK